MLTQGEDVEAHALRRRGWSISAIARHLGRGRMTVRAYLNGEREPLGTQRPNLLPGSVSTISGEPQREPPPKPERFSPRHQGRWRGPAFVSG